jgi:hypothetical protein
MYPSTPCAPAVPTTWPTVGRNYSTPTWHIRGIALVARQFHAGEAPSWAGAPVCGPEMR